MHFLVTGGLGFIGSNLVKNLREKYPKALITIFDAQTYASNYDGLMALMNGDLTDVFYFKGDLRNKSDIGYMLGGMPKIDCVFHLAAESHVCNSLEGPGVFYETNVMGTFNLLDALRKLDYTGRFIHVSTDEVFGDLGFEQPLVRFNEDSPILPTSPYSSSKAGSDHLCFSYAHSFSMDICVTNCSNNYGPNQHEEKLIPATINRVMNNVAPRLYGSGEQIRDWIHVDDHCRALICIMEKGKSGERYCIGGDNELTNTEVVRHIMTEFHVKKGFIEYTNDRPTDDLRYAIDSRKVQSLGWNPIVEFGIGIRKTIDWIKKHGR